MHSQHELFPAALWFGPVRHPIIVCSLSLSLFLPLYRCFFQFSNPLLFCFSLLSNAHPDTAGSRFFGSSSPGSPRSLPESALPSSALLVRQSNSAHAAWTQFLQSTCRKYPILITIINLPSLNPFFLLLPHSQCFILSVENLVYFAIIPIDQNQFELRFFFS